MQAVQGLRERYGWGKEKLAVLLRQAGWSPSASTVGRILKRLKQRGVLRESPRRGVKRRQRRPARPYAVRKPKGYAVQAPGDLVQVDTLEVRPLPGVRFKQFTARDVVSRWDVLQAFRTATASHASTFLHTLLERTPFPVRAIQVDGGSAFYAEFEAACAALGIRLFVLPPHSPQLNAHVERAQRTHCEEFYDLYTGELDLKSVNAALQEWECTYNTRRPHHSLGLLTPAEYLLQHHSGMVLHEKLSHMY